MSPDTLVRITGIDGDLLKAILDSRKAAEALCNLVEIGPGAAHERNALKLGVRLDQNLSDYHNSLLRLDKMDIVGKAGEIAAVNDAHYYLAEHHEFGVSEVEYLLKFQNPLEVVADAWMRRTEDISDISYMLQEVFDKQDALQDYALVSDAPAVTVAPEMKAADTRDELFERIAKHHCFFETLEIRNRDSLDFREVSVWGMKSALEEAYEAGLARQIAQSRGIDRMDADYAEPGEPAAAKDDPQSHAAAEKRSVLAQIRETAKAPREPRPFAKDKPDKSGPEL